MSIQVRCNAKLNLFLKVYGVRDDGYHDLVSVMQSIGLTDILFIEETDSGKIEIESNDPDIPRDDTNLVWKAAESLASATGREPGGLKFRIEKNIPSMGGLAGGSSNAAGALAGLNNLWKLGMEDSALMEVATEVGSDVPFCLIGGTCMVGGRGENVVPMPRQLSATNPESAFFLAFPDITVNTAEAYGLVDKHQSECNIDLPNPVEAFTMVQDIWLNAIDTNTFSTMFCNDFEEPVFGAYPDLKAIHANVRNSAGHALMSGSGSTIFAWFPTLTQALKVSETYKPVSGERWLTAIPVKRGIEIDILP